MDKRTAWHVAYALSWPSFWLTVLYGAVVLTPFAVLIMYSGERNLPFVFTVFFLVLGTLMWKCIRGYLDDGMRLAPEVFKGAILPLILGKAPTEARLKSGKALRKATWEMVRERFTAFSFAALLGSIIVTALKEPAAAVVYLPLWLATDVYFFKQMIVRKEKKPGAPDISPAQLKAFDGFDRWKGGGAARPLKIAVLWPLVFFFVLWIAYPLLGGAITLPLSPNAAEFFAEEEKADPQTNGIYAILGMGAEGDLHAAGLRVAEELKNGAEAHAPVMQFPEGTGSPCRVDIELVKEQACMPLANAARLIAANKRLLDDYEALYGYDVFVWPSELVTAPAFKGEAPYIKTVMELGLLKIISYLDLARKGSAERAVKEWLYHTAFLAKMMQGTQSLEAYNAHQYVYREALTALLYILEKEPSLAAKYIGGIRKSFVHLGPRDIDMVALLRNDSRYIAWSADRQVDDAFRETGLYEKTPAFLHPFFRKSFEGTATVFRSKLYWFMREMEQVVREGRDDIDSLRNRMKGISKRYSTRRGRLLHGLSDLFTPHVSAVANLLLGHRPEAYSVVLFDFVDYNMQRMLLAYVESLAAGVPPEGMDSFLKGKAASMAVPLVELEAGAPFYRESGKTRLCYDEPPPYDEKTGERMTAYNGPKMTHCLETVPFVE